MFGYIIPDKPELKIKEYDIFRSYYCGLCKSMGRNSGILSRFALNYDSVFLALFLSSLHNEDIKVRKEICFANPIKKKYVVKDSKSMEYASDINIMLMYHKLKDDWADEKNIISAGGVLAFRHTYKRAAKRNAKANSIILNSLSELRYLEKEKCDSFDRAAEPFAQMMKSLLSEGYYGDNEKDKRKLEWMGYNIGKWIYIIDAYDDLDRDLKKNCYNPLVLQFGYKEQSVDDFKAIINGEVKECLTHALWQASNALELISVNNKGIIDNIIYEGMYKKMETILDKRSCKKHG